MSTGEFIVFAFSFWLPLFVAVLEVNNNLVKIRKLLEKNSG